LTPDFERRSFLDPMLPTHHIDRQNGGVWSAHGSLWLAVAG
jgi:hypothetical protein